MTCACVGHMCIFKINKYKNIHQYLAKNKFLGFPWDEKIEKTGLHFVDLAHDLEMIGQFIYKYRPCALFN